MAAPPANGDTGWLLCLGDNISNVLASDGTISDEVHDKCTTE